MSVTVFTSGKPAATEFPSDLSEGTKGAIVKIRMKLEELGLCIDGKALNIPLGSALAKKYLKHEKRTDSYAEKSPHLLMVYLAGCSILSLSFYYSASLR